jgi:hypothetical protein
MDITAYEGSSGAGVYFVYDSSNIDVESCNFKVRVGRFESDDESNSLVNSVAALEHAKKFTDSETTALTVRGSDRLCTLYTFMNTFVLHSQALLS